MVKIDTVQYWHKIVDMYYDKSNEFDLDPPCRTRDIATWFTDDFGGVMRPGQHPALKGERNIKYGYIAFANDADATFFSLRFA